MDEEPLPSPAHATMPSSPLLHPRLRALSPTSSSPPPLFSEDDPSEAADITNYESPREKRKRVGTWWQTGARTAPKRRQMKRNLDSGVYMMSDDSQASADTSFASTHFGFDGTSDIPSDPPAPEPSEARDRQIERATHFMTESEASLYRGIQAHLESNSTSFDFARLGIQDEELHHLRLLNQVVTVPPDASTEVPAEGQYRSMIPELHLTLSFNNLRRLSPTLFNLQNLVSLTLRDNCIEEIPPQIENLKSLRTLDLCHNRIRTLPCELLSLCIPTTTVLRLVVTGNPLCEVGDFNYREYLPLQNILDKHVPATQWDSEWDCALPKWLSALASIPHREERFTQDHMARFLRYCTRDITDLERHHRYAFAFSDQNKNLINLKLMPIFVVTRTTVSYYDHIGRLLKNCPALPLQEKFVRVRTSWQDADAPIIRPTHTQPGLMVPTILGTEGIPPTWFDRPSASKTHSLLAMSLSKAYEVEPEGVRELLGGEMPPEVEDIIAVAEQNMATIYKPFRKCHCCGREYIVPRAEWIEGWLLDRVVIPIKVMVCSWGCVPDVIAKRPEPLKWLDVKEDPEL